MDYANFTDFLGLICHKKLKSVSSFNLLNPCSTPIELTFNLNEESGLLWLVLGHQNEFFPFPKFKTPSPDWASRIAWRIAVARSLKSFIPILIGEGALAILRLVFVCFISKNTELDFDGYIWFSRIRSLNCTSWPSLFSWDLSDSQGRIFLKKRSHFCSVKARSSVL